MHRESGFPRCQPYRLLVCPQRLLGLLRSDGCQLLPVRLACLRCQRSDSCIELPHEFVSTAGQLIRSVVSERLAPIPIGEEEKSGGEEGAKEGSQGLPATADSKSEGFGINVWLFCQVGLIVC